MAVPPMQNSRRALTVWSIGLVAAVVLVLAGNLLMARYGNQMRDARPETYIAEAERLMNREDFPGAFAAWHKAYERGPESPLVHKVLGDLHHRLSHWEEASGAYEKALAMGSDSTGVRLNLLVCFLERARYEELARRGRAFMDAGFDDPFFPRYVAEAHFRLKRFQEAIPYINWALEGFQNDLYLLLRLEQCHQAIGNTEEAEAVRKRIAEVEQTVQSFRES